MWDRCSCLLLVSLSLYQRHDGCEEKTITRCSNLTNKLQLAVCAYNSAIREVNYWDLPFLTHALFLSSSFSNTAFFEQKEWEGLAVSQRHTEYEKNASLQYDLTCTRGLQSLTMITESLPLFFLFFGRYTRCLKKCMCFNLDIEKLRII